MHALIVLSNPDSSSLSRDAAVRLREALGGEEHAEIADLAVEEFSPIWSLADRRAYSARGPVPDDVAAEQRRVRRASDLILVFPVYWWAMPAQLKGWIDRVFTNGWAYDGGGKGLDWLRVHVVALAASEADVYERHGYGRAIQTQLQHGVIEYCHSRSGGAFEYVHGVESGDADRVEREVEQAIAAVVAAVQAP